MTVVRQIIAAFMAVALAWIGAAAPVQAHTHGFTNEHSAEPHAIVDLDHGHAHHDDDHDHHDADTPSGNDQAPHKHENGVFHVHAMTFVAVETQAPAVLAASVSTSVDMPVLVVPLHTRSVLPTDRPPRSFL